MWVKLRLMEIISSVLSKNHFHIVPLNRFPSKTIVYDIEGKEIKVVNEVALNEIIPKGFMATRTGKEIWDGERPQLRYTMWKH
jgi:hypothetical protein